MNSLSPTRPLSPTSSERCESFFVVHFFLASPHRVPIAHGFRCDPLNAYISLMEDSCYPPQASSPPVTFFPRIRELSHPKRASSPFPLPDGLFLFFHRTVIPSFFPNIFNKPPSEERSLPCPLCRNHSSFSPPLSEYRCQKPYKSSPPPPAIRYPYFFRVDLLPCTVETLSVAPFPPFLHSISLPTPFF